MQEMSRKRDANKTYVSRERSIERKMCQQTRMSRGQRCRVVETQRDRERERERERSKEGAVREKDRRRKTEMSCLYKKRLLKHGMQNVSPALPGS